MLIQTLKNLIKKYSNQYVLYIWDVAGVASNLAKYQKRLFGWNNCVIIRKGSTPYNITIYGHIWDCGAKIFYIKAILKSIFYKIIHVNSAYKMVKMIKILFPWKKIIIHYHGTDIRGRWNDMRKYWETADTILVSTPDLLEGAPEKAIYLPNTVDTDIFKPILEHRKPNTALFFFIQRTDIQEKSAICSSIENLKWAKNISNDMDLELTILDRDNAYVPYKELPEYLNQFEYFIDRKQYSSLSKTALEALACGLKVIRWDNKVVKGLPEEHKIENVILNLKKIYLENMYESS